MTGLFGYSCLLMGLLALSGSPARSETVPPKRILLGPPADIKWSSVGEGTLESHQPGGGIVWKITAKNPFEQSGAFTLADLPPETPALQVSAEFRATELLRGEKAWHNGRIRIDFLDSHGSKIGESGAIDRLEGNSPAWIPVTRRFPVPPGASRVRISLELFLPRSGSIEFRDLRVRALDREEADKWRSDAQANIEKIRKATLSVAVVDEQGRPVPNAAVRVRMRRHAYPFGTAMVASKLLKVPEDANQKNYRDTCLNFFNYATLENDLKQGAIERNTIGPAVEALRLLGSHGIQARGHVLLWPSWQMSAPSLASLKENPEKVAAWIRNHIQTTVGATAGLVCDWDVMNEPAVHNDIMNLIGREAVVEWFRLARRSDPGVSLYLNENNVEFGGTNQESLAGWIDMLKSKGAPIDGVGWQGHMWQRTLPYGPAILDDLKRYEKYGLKIQITEYDCNDRFGDDEEAGFLKDFLPAWFSHPSTSGFIMWGFQDDNIWTGNAPLFNRDWSLKPAGKVWMDFVFGKWWSDSDGTTDNRGRYETRAFLGDHTVQVVHDGKVETVETRLPKEGKALTVALTAVSPSWNISHELQDSNPYRSGKLPGILEVAPPAAKSAGKITISTDQGRGADAVVGPANPVGSAAFLTLVGSPDMKSRHDLYLRFDLTRMPKGPIAAAGLALKWKDETPVPFSARLYAMSERFVPAEGEMREDWDENLIAADGAPGRDASGNDYRLGDAALTYLGDWRPSAGKGEIQWQSKQLALVVSRTLGKTLTILVVPDEGVRGSFRSKEYGSSDAPRLTIESQ